jgi:hypothetical protein
MHVCKEAEYIFVHPQAVDGVQGTNLGLRITLKLPLTIRELIRKYMWKTSNLAWLHVDTSNIQGSQNVPIRRIGSMSGPEAFAVDILPYTVVVMTERTANILFQDKYPEKPSDVAFPSNKNLRGTNAVCKHCCKIKRVKMCSRCLQVY